MWGKMASDSTVILFLSILFGVMLLCRIGFQINKRIEVSKRHHRIPSSANASTLTFDAVLAGFLILVAYAIAT